MAIRQRGNRYQVDVALDGQRVRQSAGSLEEARQLEAEIRETIKKGSSWDSSTPRNGTAVTLADLREHTWKRRWKEKKSGEGLHRNAERVCSVLGDDTPIHKIDLKALYGVRDALSARGNSDATVNRKLAALSTMLTEAKAMGWIKDKPQIPMAKTRNGRIRWLSEEEEREVLSWVEFLGFPEYARLFLIALDTGARMGELRKLEVRDVDLQRGTVAFWDTKADTPRTIPLYTRTLEAIQQQLGEAYPGSRPPPAGLVWPTVTRRMVNTVWDMAREKMDLLEDEQFVPHALRHTCASRLVQNGVDIRVVKDWLGHLSLSTTLRYAHLAPKNLFQARDLMEARTQ